jgi:alpha-glucosidase
VGFLSKLFKKAQTDAIFETKSPNGRVVIVFELTHGDLYYSVKKDDKEIVHKSRLGLRLRNGSSLDHSFSVVRSFNRQKDETWEAYWGEQHYIRDNYVETIIYLEEVIQPSRLLTLRFRAYDDGVAFRYEIPAQPEMSSLVISEEMTEFCFNPNDRSWSIPAYQPDRYEYIYTEKSVYELQESVHTPLTIKSTTGNYVALHEACLYNYGGMTVKMNNHGLQADITPLSDGMKAYVNLPFNTPWRMMIIADNPLELTTSRMMLNLNPAPRGDFSWVKPIKFLGIWWAMFVGEWTWAPGDRHGATTDHAKEYIDYCTRLGLDGLLIEGWNDGWEGDWLQNGVNNKFLDSTPDFDLDEVCRYAKEKGVEIVGHHETVGFVDNYESQIDNAYKHLQERGVKYIKSGYAGSRMVINNQREFHHSQLGVMHYQYALELAAHYGIMLDVHEPIKSTGIERTWPNLMTREGARGQEYEGGGLSPSHTCFLPYTRLLAGGMDYTSGIFDVGNPTKRIVTTITRQIAYYVTIYSGMQMAADRPRFYEESHPDLYEFIRDVPVNWEQTVPLMGEIGQYYVVARQAWNSPDWYVGGVTNEDGRKILLGFDYLEEGATYKAKLYRDSDDAHYRDNQLGHTIEERTVRKGDRFEIYMAPGGGFALELKKK